MKTIIIIVIIALLCITPVLADYNFYTTYGNDRGNKHNVHQIALYKTYREVNPPSGSAGPYGGLIEPVVDDYNADGIMDIITTGTNDDVNLLSGSDPSAEISSLNIGLLEISPVSCDINGDNKPEYIGVYNQGSNNTLYVLSVTKDNHLTIVASINTTITSSYANMICSQFYANNGDNNYYVFWLDNTQQLHKAYINEGVLYDMASNPEDSVGKFSGAYFPYGQSTIIQDDNWDEDKKTIIFASGEYLIAINDDGQTYNKNYYNAQWGGAGSGRFVLIGGVNNGKAGSRIFIGQTGYTTTGSPGFYTQVSPQVTYHKGYFNSFSLDSSATISYGLNTGVFGFHAYAVGAYANDTTVDTIYRLEKPSTGTETINAMYSNTLLVRQSMTSPYTAPLDSIDAASMRLYAVALSGGNGVVFSRDGRVFYVNVNETRSVNMLNYTAATNNTPVIADLNGDNVGDFYVAQATATKFFMSSAAGAGKTNIPFTARFLNITKDDTYATSGTASFLIELEKKNYYDEINYGVICDTNTTVIYADRYTPATLSYKEIVNNITVLSDSPLGNDGTVNLSRIIQQGGITVTIDGVNTTYFNFERRTGKDYRLNPTAQDIYFKNDGNITFDIIFKSNDNAVTDYLQLRKDGTNVSFYRLINGIPIFLASALTTTSSYIGTLPSNEIFAKFIYYPKVDGATGRDYFTLSIEMNYNLIYKNSDINMSTILSSGKTFGSVEIYTDSETTFSIKGLTLDSSPFDTQLTLLNINMVTLRGRIIQGEGFTAKAINDTALISTCTFSKAGVYNQKHMVGANIDDNTNYVFTAAEPIDFPADMYQQFNKENNIPSNNITAVGDNVLTDLFVNGLGIVSATTAFIFWLVITLILTMLAFKVHVVFGGLTFIVLLTVGTVVGFVPLWVIILLAIFAGGIIVSGWYRIFTGGN